MSSVGGGGPPATANGAPKRSRSKKNKKNKANGAVAASADAPAAEPAPAVTKPVPAVAEPATAAEETQDAPDAPAAATPNGDSSTTNGAPDKFVCPLSKKVMQEPVALDSGVAYDKGAIEGHFQAGKSECPATGQPVRPEVVPLPGLKKEIDEWKEGKHDGSAAGSTSQGEPEEMGDMLGQLAQITKTLSSHLQSAEKLSRALSSRAEAEAQGEAVQDAEPLHEMSDQVQQLARQVSRLSAESGGNGTGQGKFFGSLAEKLHRIAAATADAAQRAASAVQHHATHAASAVRDQACRAADAIGHHAGPRVHAVAQHTQHAAAVVKSQACRAADAVGHHAGPAAHAVAQHAQHAAGQVGRGLGHAGREVRSRAVAVGGAIREHTGPTATAAKEQLDKAASKVAAEWNKLAPEHKGVAKAASVFLGLHLLARLLSSSAKKSRNGTGTRSVDGAQAAAGQRVDIGQLLQQLTADVRSKLVSLTGAAGHGAAPTTPTQAAGTNKGVTCSSCQKKDKGKGAVRDEEGDAASGLIESLQRTGAAALGSLQHAVGGLLPAAAPEERQADAARTQTKSKGRSKGSNKQGPFWG